MEFTKLRQRLCCVGNFRPILESPVFEVYISLLDAVIGKNWESCAQKYGKLYFLLKSDGYDGMGSCLWDALRFTENPYGRLTEIGGEDESLTAAAKEELVTLLEVATNNLHGWLPSSLPLPTLNWTADWDLDALTEFYRTSGCGKFARYRAFRWENRDLVPIEHPDSPQPWELWGYEEQRRRVFDNAKALLDHGRVNHVLLYGDSGTGKSATVKSLLTQPELEGLRLIEVDKDHLEDIPALTRLLADRPQKFILFIDDLAFDADDRTYSQLKTILEGSLEPQPANVAIYATSNRRNLVRQTFSDRLGDEVDAAETIAEKTSLAERFGERICYLSLTPKEFLAMVHDLAQTYGLNLDDKTLTEKARQWELRHPGRTPRIAKQFISFALNERTAED